MVRIAQGGRIVIPARFRKEMGVAIGDTLVLRCSRGVVTIMTQGQAVEQAQSLLRSHVARGRSLVDELIRERRQAARTE